MIIHSDWHIHTESSYDASLPLDTLITNAREQGLRRFGVTDHVNYNDVSFLNDLKNSVESVTKRQKDCPEMILGVEFTPIAKPEFDHLALTGSREGYTLPAEGTPYDLELAVSKEELIKMGVRYAIGASHWRLDIPDRHAAEPVMEDMIREWYRQQMWLACDERVTILGHPWYHGKGLWYQDFSVIPRSMNMDIAAALKENGKYAECNPCMLVGDMMSDKFRYQYAEFLRELFEMGIPITYGSDSHFDYRDRRASVEKILSEVGFRDGDFSEIDEKDLW